MAPMELQNKESEFVVLLLLPKKVLGNSI